MKTIEKTISTVTEYGPVTKEIEETVPVMEDCTRCSATYEEDEQTHIAHYWWDTHMVYGDCHYSVRSIDTVCPECYPNTLQKDVRIQEEDGIRFKVCSCPNCGVERLPENMIRLADADVFKDVSPHSDSDKYVYYMCDNCADDLFSHTLKKWSGRLTRPASLSCLLLTAFLLAFGAPLLLVGSVLAVVIMSYIFVSVSLSSVTQD